MTTNPPPPMLGKYRIDGILGEGAMGVVYRAFDSALNRPVAVKTIRKEVLAGAGGAEMLERFRREASAGVRLFHRHVVGVYEFGEDREMAYIAMEFVDGKSLRDLIQTRACWPLLEAVDLVQQLLEALDFFHERGIVHRDIKPANIMVDSTNSLTVTDFGIARVDSSDLTQVGVVLGTPSYMSPEQISGLPIDGRSDLFAVGVILYEMLTGNKPFRGEIITMAHHIVCDPHPDPSTLNSSLPAAVDRLFLRALAKRPEERFQSGAEFREALRAMVAEILARAEDGTLPPADPDAIPPVFPVARLPEPTLAPTGASGTVPASSPPSAGTAETTSQRKAYTRCPNCNAAFDPPRAWNAVCSGCGLALFEAEERAGKRAAGSAGGGVPKWLIVAGVVLLLLVVLAFVWRR